MEKKLVELIETKTFDELTPVEREFVLTQCSEIDYRRRNEVVTNTRHFFQTEAEGMVANDAIRINALAALRAKKKSKRTVVPLRILQHKIPTWSAVAAACIVFLVVYYAPENRVDNNGKKTQQIVKTDTLYIERFLKDTVLKFIEMEPAGNESLEKRAFEKDLTQMDEENALENGPGSIVPRHGEFGSVYLSYDTNMNNYGRSLKEDELAKKLLTVRL